MISVFRYLWNITTLCNDQNASSTPTQRSAGPGSFNTCPNQILTGMTGQEELKLAIKPEGQPQPVAPSHTGSLHTGDNRWRRGSPGTSLRSCQPTHPPSGATRWWSPPNQGGRWTSQHSSPPVTDSTPLCSRNKRWSRHWGFLGRV
jgi:hypothetical protein